MQLKKSLLLLIILILSLSHINAEVKLPSLIGSNMVLQRETEVKIWGETENGKSVKLSTSWDNSVYSAKSDKEGRWSVKVRTPEAGGPYTIIIDDGDVVTLDNILIGEVWICAGQSNMDMPLKGYPSQPVQNSLETIIKADKNSGIRLFRVAHTISEEPLDTCRGEWQVSSMESAADFSAVGYYFAVDIHENLGIPVGMIQSSLGATRIESWMDEKSAASVDPKVIETNPAHRKENRLGALYNGMIHPLTGYKARGFLWYQGEDNKGYPSTYPQYMSELVKLWRDRWNDDNMPFYYVQIAPFDHDIPMHRFGGEINPFIVPIFVEAQIKALDIIPNSGMAVTTDAGDSLDIHPSRKDLVGRRLALLALTKTYGRKGIDATGPLYESVKYEDGQAVVTFKTESTLCPVNQQPITGFEIAGKDKVFFPANAIVEGSNHVYGRSVRVWSEEVSDPVAVRYAFRNVVSEANLSNTVGLPAFPFRTDSWDY